MGRIRAKRLLTAILCAALVLMLLPSVSLSAHADSGGSLLPDPDALQIYTASDLMMLENSSASFVLMNDIDLSTVVSWTKINSFSGTLDGQEHKIFANEASHSLLFSTLKKGSTVKNLDVLVNTLSAVVESGTDLPSIGILAESRQLYSTR